jgi:hypothetical protein
MPFKEWGKYAPVLLKKTAFFFGGQRKAVLITYVNHHIKLKPLLVNR